MSGMPASSIVSDMAAMEAAFRPPAFRHDAAAMPAHHKLLPPPPPLSPPLPPLPPPLSPPLPRLPPSPPSPHGGNPRTGQHVLTGDWGAYTSTGEPLLTYSIEEAPGGSFTVRKKKDSGYWGAGHLSATRDGPPDALQMISINISGKIEERGWLNAAQDRITWSYGDVWSCIGCEVWNGRSSIKRLPSV